jgi:quercetin dioxygenase-like cupin family protein
MARPGDELHNPKTGQRLIFRRTTAETGGELVEVESVWAPGGDEPVAHYHPKQTEEFEVLAGRVGTRIGRAERTYEPGERFSVPPGTVHGMWNAADGETRARWVTRPALRTEAFFEAMWGLAERGEVNEKGVPPLPMVALIMREYDDEFRLARPQRAVQRVLFAVLGVVAGRRGYSLPASASDSSRSRRRASAS